MIAYKFLRSVRTGPFSGFRWPEPGQWVRVPGDLARCRVGVHACRTLDLPWWLAGELWEIELDGTIQLDEHKLVASAGRLLAQVEEWTPECADEYAHACAWRARDRAVQALTRTGHDQAADRLRGCETLDDVLTTARQLGEYTPDARVSLTIAGDGAVRALTGAAPTSAYIAAHAAMRLDGPPAYAAERQWQSQWLTDRLSLRPDR